MKRAATILFAIATTAFGFSEHPLLAQQPSPMLSTVDSVQIDVADHVTDDCWTNVAAVETVIELGLRRNGIRIYNKGEPLGSVLN